MKIEKKYLNSGFIVFVFVLLNSFFKEYIFTYISIRIIISALISLVFALAIEYFTRNIKHSNLLRIIIIIFIIIFLRIYSLNH